VTQRKVVHVPLEAARWPLQRDWAQLDDLCDGVFDCPHSTPVITGIGPFVVRSQDVRSGVFRTDEAARVSEETYRERIARAEPTHGDVLYSREGTYFGIAAEVPENVRVCLGQRMVLIRPKRNVLDTRFLRLWLNSPTLFRHIHGFRDGTVAERLNMPTIRALPVPLFDHDEQRTIATVVCAFDDKIELNRRMNATLEATAQSIFKDWFVDFGPVRAKVEGRPSYLAPELWALFPSRIGDDGRPAGWEERRVEDILELAYGKSLPSNERIDGNVPVYGSSGITGYHNTALVDGPSVIVGRKGTVGSLYWEDRPFFPIDTVFYVKPKAALTLCFYMLQTLGLEGMNTDAAVPGLNRNNVYRLRLPWAPDRLQQAFDKFVQPIRRMMRANTDETKTLAHTRDSLLPNLISGELRVNNIEGIAEAVL